MIPGDCPPGAAGVDAGAAGDDDHLPEQESKQDDDDWSFLFDDPDGDNPGPDGDNPGLGPGVEGIQGMGEMVGPAVEDDMDAASLFGPLDSDGSANPEVENMLELEVHIDGFLSTDQDAAEPDDSGLGSAGTSAGSGSANNHEAEIDALFEPGALLSSLS